VHDAGAAAVRFGTAEPVTLRTTSGLVRKIRPALLMITMSVSAGPQVASPAAGPSTTESAVRAPTRTIAAKICPTHPGRPHLRPAGRRRMPAAEHRDPFPDGRVDRVDRVDHLPATAGAAGEAIVVTAVRVCLADRAGVPVTRETYPQRAITRG
jgi:hypothetical protein